MISVYHIGIGSLEFGPMSRMGDSNRRISGDRYGDITWDRAEQERDITASQRIQANQQISRMLNNTAQGSNQQSKDNLICVQTIPVSSPDILAVGDHVIFHRNCYDHHGIITKTKSGYRFKVAEATKPSIGEGTITCSWKKFEYTVTDVSVADYTHRFSKDDTAKRAKKIYQYIRKHPKSYTYNVFTNNCEHFATYCATGKLYSLQVAELASGNMLSFIRLRFVHIKFV